MLIQLANQLILLLLQFLMKLCCIKSPVSSMHCKAFLYQYGNHQPVNPVPKLTRQQLINSNGNFEYMAFILYCQKQNTSCQLLFQANLVRKIGVISRAGRYWNLLSRYITAKNILVLLYITIFSNYAMECIIVVDQLQLHTA